MADPLLMLSNSHTSRNLALVRSACSSGVMPLASAERWIQSQLPAVEEFFDAMRQGTGATRIVEASDSLVAVLNDVA